MSVRYVVTKVEVCKVCDGTGRRLLSRNEGLSLYDVGCNACYGTGEAISDIDADEWLKAALVRIGMYGDGR